MNRRSWNWNWGGALISQNKQGQIGMEFPEYNKMWVQSDKMDTKNYVRHTTSILSQSAPPRFSLQIFADRDPSGFRQGENLKKFE